MPFSAKLLPIDLNPEAVIPPLLKKARQIGDCKTAPKGIDGCKDCQKLNELIQKIET